MQTATLAGLMHRFAGVDSVISLAAGLPPAEAFPATAITATTRDGAEIRLGPEEQQVFLAQQYNFNPQGYGPLLDWLRNLTAQLHGVPVQGATLMPPQPPSPQRHDVSPPTQPQQQEIGATAPAATAPRAQAPVAASPPPAPDGQRASASATTSGTAEAGAVKLTGNGGDADRHCVASQARGSISRGTDPHGPDGGGGGGPLRDVVLTSGAIHAIGAVIACLTDPGDIIVVDEYTYTHALECVFLPRGLRLLPVRSDPAGGGIDPEDLDRQLRRAAQQAARQHPAASQQQQQQQQQAAAGAAAGAVAPGPPGVRAGRPRLLYTVPTGHNPTGAVLSLERRKRILEVCEAHDLLVLEDDAYFWLYYPQQPQEEGEKNEEGRTQDQQQQQQQEAPLQGQQQQQSARERHQPSLEGTGAGASGQPPCCPSSPSPPRPARPLPGLSGLPRSLLSLDRTGRVIRVDTFSKLLGPGYRLGWITAAPPLVAKLADWSQGTTVGPCSVTQVLVSRLLQHWGLTGFEAHVRRLQDLYGTRAAAAHRAAVAHLAGLAEWRPVEAGMFMWLRVMGVADMAAAMDELVAARVVAVPGRMFSTRGLQATLDVGDSDGEGVAAAGCRVRDPASASAPGGGGPVPPDVAGSSSPAVAPVACSGFRSPYLRLSFAGCSEELVEEGIRRLAAVIRAVRAQPAGTESEASCRTGGQAQGREV